MALIHRTASEGSPEKSAGRAALSSVALVDMGMAGGAGGTALCLGVLGVEGTVVVGIGEDGRPSSSLSGWLSP